MANYTGVLKKYMNMSLKTIWKDIRTKPDPDKFVPNGSQIYHGYQGEGKTLSMFHHAMKLKQKYPKSLICSNLQLLNMSALTVKNEQELQQTIKFMDMTKEYILFQSHEDLILLLRSARNGHKGVIFMIDEIHNYFHSHDSKSMPMWVVQVFSQQRKQHLIILGTVQDWPDVIKAIRQQIDNLISCKKILGYIIINTAVDPRTAETMYGETKFDVRKRGFFFITEAIRNGFDTFQVINSGREIMGGEDLIANVSVHENKNKGWKRG